MQTYCVWFVETVILAYMLKPLHRPLLGHDLARVLAYPFLHDPHGGPRDLAFHLGHLYLLDP